ncbi:MAG: YdbH domain-containing protein, partial [Pirellulales bacterium]|nr:YdbH domain-containing protein [Pirellulales bacterium]
FGGLIQTDRFRVDPLSLNFSAVLKVSDIDLARALAFAEFGEFQATGTLEGQLPIIQENGAMAIRNGFVSTTKGGGRILYNAAGVGDALVDANQATELLVKALRDFQYDVVSLYYDEINEGEARLRIRIKRVSEEVYGGLPLELNANIEGPLRQILSDTIDDVDVPREIRILTGAPQ